MTRIANLVFSASLERFHGLFGPKRKLFYSSIFKSEFSLLSLDARDFFLNLKEMSVFHLY